MRDLQAMVEEFHRKHGAPIGAHPAKCSPEERQFRIDLMKEELKEYIDASAAGDEVEMYDALLDLLYVTIGTLVVHGFPLESGFAEVHRSNMTKDAIKVVGGASKVAKGPNFTPPDLGAILNRALLAYFDGDVMDTAPKSDPEPHTEGGAL